MKTRFTIDHFEQWTRLVLPSLNTATEVGELSVDNFGSAFRPWVTACSTYCRSTSLSTETARRLLVLLTFGVNSTERHHQTNGAEQGEGLRSLEHAEDLLLTLGGKAGLPPHGSLYTVWLLNRSNPPLTFTGDAQERFFHAAVLRTNDFNQESCRLLRMITKRRISLRSQKAIEAMGVAERNAHQLQRLYTSFMVTEKTTGQRPITPEFFATRMRTYLVSYPVANQMRSGGNAGDLPSQIQLDHIIGTTMKRYERILSHRLPNLTGADRRQIHEDIARPSIFDLFLQDLGVSRSTCEGDRDPSVLVNQLPGSTRPAAKALARLIKAHGDASAAHWALIVNFLIRIDRHVDQVTVPVPTSHGTGGLDHETTHEIMRMRREHPAAAWRIQ
jgi:hypothetical protein